MNMDRITASMKDNIWTLVNSSNLLEEAYYPYLNNFYGKALFRFYFKRVGDFYFVSLLLPSYGLRMLLFFIGIMPPHLPDRPNFTITVVLATAVLQGTVTQSIPKTADVPLLVTFLAFNQCCGIIVCFYNLLTVNLASHKFSKQKFLFFHISHFFQLQLSFVRCVDICFYSLVLIAFIMFDSSLWYLMFN